MGRYPVDVTTILVGAHVVLAVFTAFLVRFGPARFLESLMFDSPAVWHGEVWRLFTYAFIHPPGMLLWFAIEMYMLFVFGREVEKFIGQRAFIVLYAVLLLVPAIVLAIWGVWQAALFAGSPILHFGIFVAFATIYPSAEMFLRISAKWTAGILIGIYSLMMLAGQPWYNLVALWVTVAAAFIFIRTRGVGAELVWWENVKSQLQPKPKFKVLPKARPVPTPADGIAASVDPILDKIAQSGIASLTPGERQTLDRAREELLKSSE